MIHPLCIVLIVVGLILPALSRPAVATPMMIRLGYTNCTVCHLSPQGGGPLTPYGRSVDEGESLRAGEYKPSENGIVSILNAKGRIHHDLRVMVLPQVSGENHRAWTGSLRTGLTYRNATEFGSRARFSFTLNGNMQTPKPPLQRTPNAPAWLATSALVQFRPTDTVEIAFGRDRLPAGINTSNSSAFIRSRNRLGYYDNPTQVKVFWAGGRYQVASFLFGPGGLPTGAEPEAGGGTAVEVNVPGQQKAVVGLTVLKGSGRSQTRRLLGGHARLGFGPWGILAEHDVTGRVPRAGSLTSRQHATYVQASWAAREWLVASWAGEHLHVGRPLAQHQVAGNGSLSVKFTSQISLGLSARTQHDLLTRRRTQSASVVLFVKTVD